MKKCIQKGLMLKISLLSLGAFGGVSLYAGYEDESYNSIRIGDVKNYGKIAKKDFFPEWKQLDNDEDRVKWFGKLKRTDRPKAWLLLQESWARMQCYEKLSPEDRKVIWDEGLLTQEEMDDVWEKFYDGRDEERFSQLSADGQKAWLENFPRRVRY